jgi:hypothetical protein
MDPGNPQWQAYYLDKVKGFQSDPGWSGLFLDNVDGSLGRFENMHSLLENYADDADYQQAVVSFLGFLYNNYFAPSGKPLYANIPYLKNADTWFAYLQYLDGAMLESFAADWDRGYLNVEDWLAQLDLAEKTQALGKRVILVTQGSATDQQRMQYGLASFCWLTRVWRISATAMMKRITSCGGIRSSRLTSASPWGRVTRRMVYGGAISKRDM